MKGYHLLMRIAHMINTLVQYVKELAQLFISKGMRGAIKYLDEIFRKTIINPIKCIEAMAKPYYCIFV